MDYTHIDLFSGIGGFALAAKWAGVKTVQFVEIDKFCHKVLNKNFPGVPIHEDIRTFTNCESNGLQGRRMAQYGNEGRQLAGSNEQIASNTELHGSPCSDGEGSEAEPQEPEGKDGIGQSARRTTLQDGRPFLITGGFPCQPFSCAGKRKGDRDDRFLWPEMLRVIKEFHPTWVIGENVAGIASMVLTDNGIEVGDNDAEIQTGERTNVLVRCITDLEAIGYDVQAFCIPACSLGAPHRRDRIWIVGNRIGKPGWQSAERGMGMAGQLLPQAGRNENSNGIIASDRDARYSESSSKREIKEIRKGQNPDTARGVKSDRHAADSEHSKAARLGQHGREILSNKETGLNREASSWHIPWTEVAQRFCKLDDELPPDMDGRGITRNKYRVQKLKALGNAIVPQVAFQIIKGIVDITREEP